jgi:DNA-binding protein HU-beta
VNKSGLIDAVSKTTSLAKRDAEEAVNALVHVVSKEVRSGRRVVVAGFGSFNPTHRGARMGRNPRTGAPVSVSASRGVRFAASAMLKDVLNGKAPVPAPKVSASPAKKTAKKSTGTVVKKATNKAAKKATKRVASKATKISTKKAVKRTAGRAPKKVVGRAPVRKTTRAPARKAARKSARKAAGRAPARKAIKRSAKKAVRRA